MKGLSVVAFAAIASQALAKPQPMPYKPVKAFLSAREIFGLDRRDTYGYHPIQSICGAGPSCAEACGEEYLQCPSSDNQLHCYNVKANELCCGDDTGNSCEDGYYCSGDSTGQTWCCPEGMDLDTCASKYQVTGALHSNSAILPTSTTSSASSTSTSVVSSTTPSVSSSVTSSVSSSVPSAVAFPVVSHAVPHVASTVSHVASSATSAASSALAGGVFFDTGNSTAIAISATGALGGATATPTSASGAASATGSSTAKSGASSSSPATFLALVGAAAFAAFF
ncbi:hypothetical protein VM1G_03866 [Cytospora mali]|uniref:Prp 4 CRoW domain-containing protein n=1 Tax=Cytospora mali TaxID=578113 RepID=A0A194VWM6_CYTMA|nr:hypothetical protein VM1G_03866 [Valsa mali]